MIRCPVCTQSYSSDAAGCPQCGFRLWKMGALVGSALDMECDGPGLEEEYFRKLAKFEEGNFWFRSRNALIIWALRKYAPAFKSFMEIGCGNGFVLSGIRTAFPTVRLFGSNLLSEGLRVAAERLPSVQFMRMDGRRIPFEDEFDVIGAFDVLEHIEEDNVALAEMFRAVKPGGDLLITVPQHRWLWSASDDHACHVRRYGWRELETKVANAGFDIIRSTSFVTVLLPVMFWSRRYRQSKRPFDPFTEFRLSRTSNYVLEMIMNLERLAIRAGLSLPIGGSRLVVAKRRSK